MNGANKNWFMFLVIMAYSISGIASIRLFWNMSPSLLDQIVLVAMVTTYQIAIWFTLKYVFEILKIAVDGKITYKNKNMSRITFFVAYSFFSIFSIVASAALVYNSNATASNKALITQANIENQIKAKKLAPAIVEAKTKEMNELAKTKNNTIQSYDNNKSNFSWKAASKINEIEDKKTAAVSSIDGKIRDTSTELSDLAKSLASPIKEDSSATSSFGITGVITSPWWQTAFCIAFGIGIDFIGAFFTFAYAKEKYYADCGKNPEPENKEIPRPKNVETSENKEVKEILGGRLKGLKFKAKDNIREFRPKETIVDGRVAEGDIQKYLDFVMANQKNGLAPGRNKIVNGVGLSQEKCRTIHNILIDRGILETGEKCTRILKVSDAI